jgi:hypothetical protein
MFENKMPKKIFGPKWDEVSEQFKILHNGELCHLYKPHCALRMLKCGRLRQTGGEGDRTGIYTKFGEGGISCKTTTCKTGKEKDRVWKWFRKYSTAALVLCITAATGTPHYKNNNSNNKVFMKFVYKVETIRQKFYFSVDYLGSVRSLKPRAYKRMWETDGQFKTHTLLLL